MSTIERSGSKVTVEVSVFVYQDTQYPNGDMFIAYCPELDLTGYDTTPQGARDSFQYVLKDYLDYTLKNGTLEADLLKHGWRKYKNGRIVKPSLDTMLRKSQLKTVLNQTTLNKFPYSLCV